MARGDSAATKGEPAGDPYMNKVRGATVKAVGLPLRGLTSPLTSKEEGIESSSTLSGPDCMCIVYPRSGRTFQTAPLDTPKHDNCPRIRRLVVHWSGIWQILTLPTPARQLAPLCPKGTGMGCLRLQTLPTVTVPGRRAAGHRRQKRRSLYHTAGGEPKAPAPVVRDHRHHTQARPAARPRRCCVDHRRKLSLQM